MTYRSSCVAPDQALLPGQWQVVTGEVPPQVRFACPVCSRAFARIAPVSDNILAFDCSSDRCQFQAEDVLLEGWVVPGSEPPQQHEPQQHEVQVTDSVAIPDVQGGGSSRQIPRTRVR